MTEIYGRVTITTTTTRPAYVAEDGTMYISPDPFTPWTPATPNEARTWQQRRDQTKAGNIQDDTLFNTAKFCDGCDDLTTTPTITPADGESLILCNHCA